MKKLTQVDEMKIKKIAEEDSATNLFILGDMEQYGFNDEIQSFYGQEAEDGSLYALIFRYRDASIGLYAQQIDQQCLDKVIELIDSYKPLYLNVGEATQTLLGNKLDAYITKKEVTKLAVYTPNAVEITTNDVVSLDTTKAEEIITLQDSVFDNHEPDTKEKRISVLEQELIDGTVSVFGIMDNNELLSVSQIVAESKTNAMIIGVATAEGARGKGYASAVVKKSCDDLFARGKKAVLFYNNPQAASIYLKLGFEEHKDFYMNKLKK